MPSAAVAGLSSTLRERRPLESNYTTPQAYANARASWVRVVITMADNQQKTKRGFDRGMFYKACGLGDE